MKKIILAVTGLFFIFNLHPAFAKESSSAASGEKLKQVLADIDQYARKGMQDWQIPGMAIAIVQGDDVAKVSGLRISILKAW